jgi:hypothetical protein
MPDVEPKVWPRQKPKRPGMPDGSVIEDLDFTIEQWSSDDSRLEEIIARIGNVAIARMAFFEAVRQRPGRRILLRQATRLVADSSRPLSGGVLDSAIADAVAACGGDTVAALRACLIANEYLEAEVERLAAALSTALASKPRAGAASATR